MFRVGILCGQDEEKNTIRHAVELLSVRENFGCLIQDLSPVPPEACSDLSCLLLAYEDRAAAFAYAEKLWQKEPSLSIVYIAYRSEDIFAALRMPFFHTVRFYNLEQDLTVIFQKLQRSKSPASDRVSFIHNGKMMLIPKREILYLESCHHEIKLHLQTDIFSVAETLTLYEKRLKGSGFIRTDRSFLVNMYYIRCLERSSVLLDNGEYLYISRRRYPEVKLSFENYIRHLDFI